MLHFSMQNTTHKADMRYIKDTNYYRVKGVTVS